ncbi:MAG TPA: hypothetical protein VLT89_09620 [Usitatibacter sp.]|nr:hypothetical protein [Usitatibacter sp.]
MRSLALVLAVPAVLAAVPAVADPFGPIHMAVNRHEYRGRGCPIEIVFTATINYTMPHPRGFVYSYHWERSDGAKGPTHTVRPADHERSMVVHEKWRLGKPGESYDVSQAIHVGSGNTHITERTDTVHVECR